MFKKHVFMAFLAIMMSSHFAAASIHITFKGIAGEINEKAMQKTNEAIAGMLKVGAVRSYTVSSVDIFGTAQICVEFIGCTNQDAHYVALLSKQIEPFAFDPAPVFEMRPKAAGNFCLNERERLIDLP